MTLPRPSAATAVIPSAPTVDPHAQRRVPGAGALGKVSGMCHVFSVLRGGTASHRTTTPHVGMIGVDDSSKVRTPMCRSQRATQGMTDLC